MHRPPPSPHPSAPPPRRRAVALTVVVLWAAACASPAPPVAPAPPESVQLTILHTNDHHGHAWAWDDRRCPGVGGLAVQGTVVRRIREEVAAAGGHVLLL